MDEQTLTDGILDFLRLIKEAEERSLTISNIIHGIADVDCKSDQPVVTLKMQDGSEFDITVRRI